MSILKSIVCNKYKQIWRIPKQQKFSK